MCGVPYHAADGYVTRLVKNGFRVAICDQVEDPRQSKNKKLLRREVVRVLSPGTLTAAGYLDAKDSAFLMAATQQDGGYGVALIDVSTGEFSAAEYTGDEGRQALIDEVALLRPREIVVAAAEVPADWLPAGEERPAVTQVEPWAFGIDAATRVLCDQFQVSSLDGFGPPGASHGDHGRRCAPAVSP